MAWALRNVSVNNNCVEASSCHLISYNLTGSSLRCRGVVGPLVDLFDCSDALYSAVEVTAGGSLFHVVVDTDVTASQIMRHLTANRVGRITCLPLNKLNVHNPPLPTTTRSWGAHSHPLAFVSSVVSPLCRAAAPCRLLQGACCHAELSPFTSVTMHGR